MQPFTLNHHAGAGSSVDVSFLLDPPAGKDGFVTIQDGHFVKPDGTRLRLWGVNITDWSDGSTMLLAKEHAPIYAAALARFGVNCVRLHFLDLLSPRGIIDAAHDDTRHFDPDQLDRLDFWIAELKRHGIYSDLNLVVGRSYKAGDGVQDYEQVGWAKALTYFDPRLIELQKEYARQLLTHYNPYTNAEYRHEPAIVIVELVNENSLIEAWCYDRLHAPEQPSTDPNFRPIPAAYAEMLTRMYNAYLEAQLAPEQLARFRLLAGTAGESSVARLRRHEFATAPAERFQTEAAFYMHVERGYFHEMQAYLKGTLGLRAPLIGSSDHAHEQGYLAKVWTNATLDILDGHVYWQHPQSNEKRNTPMVDDPLYSTVARLSRTALAGKPYIVSEVNHAFPNDWTSEGIPILAAYACLQDWDGILWYTFEPKADPDWQPYVGDAFDISLDPVKMPQLAAGALMFLRGDVRAAHTAVERSYTLEQVRKQLRMPADEKPYYTPGFPLALALRHQVRIGALDGPPTAPAGAPATNPIVSDTAQLAWYAAPQQAGLVTVDTPRSQALIGFVRANGIAVQHLAADVQNAFCAITLSALDAQPIARSARMLLTAGARVENAGQRWDKARTVVLEGGGTPSLIEPVRGRITLRNLEGAAQVLAHALDGAGHPIGAAIPVEQTAAGWVFAIGEPATTWYEIIVTQRGRN